MKSFVITLFIGVLSVQMGLGQTSLNDYHYVVVPDQFEFLKGKDQFQVNTLTVWLLNNNGFNAYLDSRLPLSLRRKPCKGLKAIIQTKENFMAFRSYVVFTDCFGNVVYTSDEGRSKDKDYRKSYHEAIRESFESITALNVTQLPIASLEDDSEEVVEATKDDSGGISSGGTPVAAIEEVKDDSGGISSGGTPVAAVQEVKDDSGGISSGGEPAVSDTAQVLVMQEEKPDVFDDWSTETLQFKEYSLVPSKNGYEVHYKGSPIGTVKATSNDEAYLVNTSQFTGVGYFSKESFVIEREIEGMDQIIKMTFTRD